MLPMLTYPLLVPVLMGSMHVSTVLLAGAPLGDPEMLWIKMMLGFDAAFTAASLVLVEYVLVG
jgi:ABC-type transport system involved in cytochrome c biogenesis permease component